MLPTSLRQTLSVVRDAITLYAAEHGGKYPGADNSQTTFRNDLQPYLRGPFPKAPVGSRNNLVKMTNSAGPIFGGNSQTEGWHYNSIDGLFIVNFNGICSDGVTQYDAF